MMMKKNDRLIVGIAAVLGGMVTADVAALSDTTNIGDSWKGWSLQKPSAEEQGVEAGAAWIYPSVSAVMVIDDNYYNAPDNQVTHTTVTVTPRIQAEIEGDTAVLRGTIEADYQYNFDDRNENLWNLRAVAEGALDPTEKLNVWGGLGWELGHEPRGEGFTAGTGGTLFWDPIEYREWSVRVGGDYGVNEEGAPKLSLEAAHLERRYQEQVGAPSVAVRDSDINQIGGSLLYWLQPNTALNLSARYSDYNYPNAPLNDSNQWRYLAGLQWDATYQTQGYGQVGWGKKDMLSNSIKDSSDTNWEVGVRWKPSTYANFALSASRDYVEETYAAYGDRKEYRAAWNHQWESYLTSSLIYNIGTEEFPADTSVFREDDYWDLMLRVNYQARPWLTLGASARHSDYNSNIYQYTYKENVYTLNADVTFY